MAFAALAIVPSLGIEILQVGGVIWLLLGGIIFGSILMWLLRRID